MGTAPLPAFTLFHVILSLVGIASGLVVMYGFVAGKRLPSWNWFFLFTTIATSVTGFYFPFNGITPGIILGVVSLVLLVLAVTALLQKWTKTYILTAATVEFFNVLVLIAQLFQKVPALHTHAPKGSEPIVAIMQLLALCAFVAVAWVAIRKSAFVLR